MYIIKKDDMSKKVEHWLNMAHQHANYRSGCLKVGVGSVIVSADNQVISFGANKSIPDCRVHGCLRIKLYGNDGKQHREPGDCNAVHSEIDALILKTQSAKGATIYITRYPCESCARAIVVAGIKEVYFGRQQEPSELTQQIFEEYGVTCNWVKDWTAEDRLD